GTGGDRRHAEIRAGLRPCRVRQFSRFDGGDMDRQGLTIHVGVHVESSLLERMDSMEPHARITYQPSTPHEVAAQQEASLYDAEVMLGYHPKFPMHVFASTLAFYRDFPRMHQRFQVERAA